MFNQQVKFDKKAKRATSVDDTRFYLLHLGLLREYLEMEFINVKDKLQFDYDIEKIIDDWIFMCFMVGNDFIPHLPNLHINSDALPTLYRAYCEVLPQMDGKSFSQILRKNKFVMLILLLINSIKATSMKVDS